MSLINARPVLCVALAPQQISFALRQGQRFLEQGSWHQACDNPEGSWQNALMLLQGGLQQAKGLRAGAALHISLASRWCPMLRMPWSDALLAPESSQRFLQNQFIALYGEMAREWQIQADDAPYGRPRLASAIDKNLLQALQELAASFSLELRLVEPLLAQAWRSVVRLQGKQTPVFALIEGERISLAQTLGGHIVQVHAESWLGAGGQTQRQWPQMLAQIWQRYCLREPEMAQLPRVAVLNLSLHAQRGELGNPFHLIHPASPDLSPSFAALICNR